MGEAIAEVGYLAGLCGHTGEDWRKLQMLWGYYDTVAELLLNDDLAAGYNSLLGAVVPAGEVWRITAASIRYVGTVPDSIMVGAVIDPTTVFVIAQESPVSNLWYPALLDLVLKEGDRMSFVVFGATATDDLYGRYAGYKMRLNL